jgi:hypothetical protein
MTYGDFQNVLQVLNTGATNPNQLGLICKLVLGKIARTRPRNRVKMASVSSSSVTQYNGNIYYITLTSIADFFDVKTDIGDRAKSLLAFYFESDIPNYFELTNLSNLVAKSSGYYAAISGNRLYFTMAAGENVPATIRFPYYSYYLVLDQDGITEKETPSQTNDTFLFKSAFDDLLIDGVLLYISRREKEDSEYSKNVSEWEKRLNEQMLLN